MDFDEQLEPIRNQYEAEADVKGMHRKNPATGV